MDNMVLNVGCFLKDKDRYYGYGYDYDVTRVLYFEVPTMRA